jgi:hypothetical protein
MAHNRKYVCGGIDLVGTRIKNSLKLMDQDKVESLLIDSHFFDSAPFKWVGLMYRYGLKNDIIPEYRRIDKKDYELPLAIELKTEILEWVGAKNPRLLYAIFMIGALEALIHVGKKYNLPIDILQKERAKYGNIPETIEECEQAEILYEKAEFAIELVKKYPEMFINKCPNCGNLRATPKARQCLECTVFSDPVKQ